MKRSLAVTLVLLAGLAGAVACGKTTPTIPQTAPQHSAYYGGWYMVSGERIVS